MTQTISLRVSVPTFQISGLWLVLCIILLTIFWYVSNVDGGGGEVPTADAAGVI